MEWGGEGERVRAGGLKENDGGGGRVRGREKNKNTAGDRGTRDEMVEERRREKEGRKEEERERKEGRKPNDKEERNGESAHNNTKEQINRRVFFLPLPRLKVRNVHPWSFACVSSRRLRTVAPNYHCASTSLWQSDCVCQLQQMSKVIETLTQDGAERR